MSEPRPTAGEPRPGYEPDRIAFGALLRFGVGLVALMIMGFLVSAWLLGRFEAEEAPSAPHPMLEARSRPAGPLLQADPSGDMAEVRAREQERLHEVGWIDRPNGVVRIPIERAMELVLERGLPARGGERR